MEKANSRRKVDLFGYSASDMRFKRTAIESVTIGGCLSLTLFFVSWWTRSFDFWVFPQLPGFWVSSLLWGFPGFGYHHPNRVRSAFLFPYVMVVVNMVFYGLLAHVVVSFSKRTAVKPGPR